MTTGWALDRRQNPEKTVELDDYLVAQLNELPEAEVPKGVRLFLCLDDDGKIIDNHGGISPADFCCILV